MLLIRALCMLLSMLGLPPAPAAAVRPGRGLYYTTPYYTILLYTIYIYIYNITYYNIIYYNMTHSTLIYYNML